MVLDADIVLQRKGWASLKACSGLSSAGLLTIILLSTEGNPLSYTKSLSSQTDWTLCALF